MVNFHPFKSTLANRIHMSRILGWSALVLLLSAALAPNGYSRDLQGRLGIGYNSEFANSSNSLQIPGASIKYAFTKDVAIEAIVGFATVSPSNSVVAGKLSKVLFSETNLNFYTMGGFGFINANARSGVQMIGGVGVEFFFPGLESLGFSMETGASLDNTTGTYALRTMGFSFLNAGMHFYF